MLRWGSTTNRSKTSSNLKWCSIKMGHRATYIWWLCMGIGRSISKTYFLLIFSCAVPVIGGWFLFILHYARIIAMGPKAFWSDTIRYDTIRYDTIRYNMIRYDMIRYNTIRYDTNDTIKYVFSVNGTENNLKRCKNLNTPSERL